MTKTNNSRISVTNMWGSVKADINPAEYCIECERDTRNGHYDMCPVIK